MPNVSPPQRAPARAEHDTSGPRAALLGAPGAAPRSPHRTAAASAHHDEVPGVPLRTGPWLLRRVSDRHRAHRVPARRQLQHLPHHVAAEHRRRHPGGAQPLARPARPGSSARRRPSRPRTSRARPRPAAASPYVCEPSITRQGTTRYGALAQHVAAPHPLGDGLLATCRRRRRSAIQASRIASSSRVRASCDSSSTNRHGVVWCGAGAVTAAATARRTAPGSTGSSVKARTVRRWVTASRTASEVPSRNMSSAAPTSDACARAARRRRPSADQTCRSPRTTATGRPAALPLTRSPAAASSSAVATTVALSGLPCASVPPRRSSSDPYPGRADRDVREPVAPGPPEGVRDDHADVDARARPAARRGSRAPTRPGPPAAAAPCPAGCWRRRPRPRPSPAPAGSPRSAAVPRRATTRTVSASIAASRSCGRDDPALGLGDDLRGDQQDVAVGEPAARPPRRSAWRGRRPARTSGSPATAQTR